MYYDVIVNDGNYDDCTLSHNVNDQIWRSLDIQEGRRNKKQIARDS